MGKGLGPGGRRRTVAPADPLETAAHQEMIELAWKAGRHYARPSQPQSSPAGARDALERLLGAVADPAMRRLLVGLSLKPSSKFDPVERRRVQQILDSDAFRQEIALRDALRTAVREMSELFDALSSVAAQLQSTAHQTAFARDLAISLDVSGLAELRAGLRDPVSLLAIAQGDVPLPPALPLVAVTYAVESGIVVIPSRELSMRGESSRTAITVGELQGWWADGWRFQGRTDSGPRVECDYLSRRRVRRDVDARRVLTPRRLLAERVVQQLGTAQQALALSARFPDLRAP